MTNGINLVTNVNEIPGTLDKKRDKHDTWQKGQPSDDKQGRSDNVMTNRITLMKKQDKPDNKQDKLCLISNK